MSGWGSAVWRWRRRRRSGGGFGSGAWWFQGGRRFRGGGGAGAVGESRLVPGGFGLAQAARLRRLQQGEDMGKTALIVLGRNRLVVVIICVVAFGKL